MKLSWPFGVALRREASSRLMLRWPKTVVVSDEGKAPVEASGPYSCYFLIPKTWSVGPRTGCPFRNVAKAPAATDTRGSAA